MRGSTATAAEQQPLTGEELQEGLMAGFGARARRKHMQRHAAGLLAGACGGADVGADFSDRHEHAASAPAAADSLCVQHAHSSSDGGQSVSKGMPLKADEDLQEEKSMQANGRHTSEGAETCEHGLHSTDLPGSRPAGGEDQSDGSHESGAPQVSAAETEVPGEQDEFQEQGTPAAVAARDLNKGGHQWHGRKVVEAVLAKGGEEELCELMARFRQCFVDALHPQHLSPSWQIDHRCA